MSSLIENYLAVSVMYILMGGLIVSKAVPSRVGKIVLASVLTFTYGYVTMLFVYSLK